MSTDEVEVSEIVICVLVVVCVGLGSTLLLVTTQPLVVDTEMTSLAALAVGGVVVALLLGGIHFDLTDG